MVSDKILMLLMQAKATVGVKGGSCNKESVMGVYGRTMLLIEMWFHLLNIHQIVFPLLKYRDIKIKSNENMIVYIL